jgi:hypothetical protein
MMLSYEVTGFAEIENAALALLVEVLGVAQEAAATSIGAGDARSGHGPPT